MITSMTGFAQGDLLHATGSYNVEIRSLNHRYLEINLRMPDKLRYLEHDIREALRKHIARGKVDCIWSYIATENASYHLQLNQDLLNQLIATQQEITAQISQTTTIDPFNLLRWPGVLSITETSLAPLKPELLQLFNTTLQQFLQDKQREGQSINTVIQQRLQTMQQYMQQLSDSLVELIKQHRNKLLARVEQFNIEIEPLRLEQEVVLLAQRADVAEEVDRLTAHIKEMFTALQTGGALGRRFDFLLQEMLRETNTLGSKSSDLQLSRIIIELKVLIEQIREQIQNIE